MIRFVEMFDKVPFPQAVSQLSEVRGQQSAKSQKPFASSLMPLTVKERKLLTRVVTYYQHLFTKDHRGLNYLKNERGITDNESLKDFGVGFVNGTLQEIQPEDEEVIQTLKKIGILNSKGHEHFYNCVVFPLYDANGSIVNLYGRNIDEENEVSHLYLPGPRSGIINRQAVKRSQSIILTESIIDALTLYD